MSDAFQLSEEDAKVVARALIVHNDVLSMEASKITNTPEVSSLVVEAAWKTYNTESESLSKLHVRLAEHFPSLRG